MQKPVSMAFDSRQLSTLRLCQPMIASKCKNSGYIGMVLLHRLSPAAPRMGLEVAGKKIPVDDKLVDHSIKRLDLTRRDQRLDECSATMFSIEVGFKR